MVVDKTLEIDLTNLSPESISTLNTQIEEIKNSLVNPDQRSILEKGTQFPPRGQSQQGLRRIFGREAFDNLLSFGQNPTGFMSGLFSSKIAAFIPIFAPIVAGATVIFTLFKRIDDFEKRFIESEENRDMFLSAQNEALIQTGQQQLILTTVVGTAEPRDAYNTFREFNENRAQLEADFSLINTSGYD